MNVRECPECGGSLPPEAPAGACPRCLLAVGLEPPDPDGASGPEGARKPDRTAPSIEEMAAHFPLLEIEDTIGHGGMGIVYRARQKALDRAVALKVLWPELGADKAFADRFTREARALARLDHPHIVRVYEFGERDGFYYLVMEFVAGANLRTLMSAGEIHPEQALAIVPQMCDALQYAHDQGVVHRDIKPANVLVDTQGRVKIADFGLAKLVEGGDDLTLTRAGQVMGTLHYMAPEQYRTPGDVDHRADIYSLGVVFYEMLTGDVPMGRFDAPSKKVEVDVRLDAVVLRALDKERDRRYQRAADVGTEVSSISSSEVPPRAAAAAAPAAQEDGPVLVEKSYTWDTGNRRPDARLSRLAVAAAACVGLSVVVLATGFGLIPIWTAGAVSVVMAALALVLGIAAWIRIGSSDGGLHGLPYALFGTFAPVALGCCGFFTWPFLLAGGLATHEEGLTITDDRVRIGPIDISEDSVDVGPIHVDENGTVVGPIEVDEDGVRIGGTPLAPVVVGGPDWLDAGDRARHLKFIRGMLDSVRKDTRWDPPSLPPENGEYRYGIEDWTRVRRYAQETDPAEARRAMAAGELGVPLLVIPAAEAPLHKYEISRIELGPEARTAKVEARVRGWRLEWTMHFERGSWYYDFAPVTRERVAEER